MTAARCLIEAQAGNSGIWLCGREHLNSLDESSMAEIKAAIAEEEFLRYHFDVGEKYIRTKDKRVAYAFAGLRENVDSIKSKARILGFWGDEADAFTEESLIKLIPSVREDGSELWFTWNPERKGSAVDRRFRRVAQLDDDVGVTEINWRDNPWFPAVLNAERLRDLRDRPDEYDHIWEGGYKKVVKGAYYAKDIAQSRRRGRIGRVSEDPLLPILAFCDIGGTGGRSDAFVMWVGQFVGLEIRLFGYYEQVGQPIASHVRWLRDNGFEDAKIILPHDGANHEKVYAVTYQSAFEAAGFETDIVENQGRGAASMRIEAGRRVFPNIWFDEIGTSDGIDTLEWYREKWDEIRNVGLGPEHDGASHCGDAFGLMAVYYELQKGLTPPPKGRSNRRRNWRTL